jgi:hypothetical protein
VHYSQGLHTKGGDFQLRQFRLPLHRIHCGPFDLKEGEVAYGVVLVSVLPRFSGIITWPQFATDYEIDQNALFRIDVEAL